VIPRWLVITIWGAVIFGGVFGIGMEVGRSRVKYTREIRPGPYQLHRIDSERYILFHPQSGQVIERGMSENGQLWEADHESKQIRHYGFTRVN
jgi:hypothetical protein